MDIALQTVTPIDAQFDDSLPCWLLTVRTPVIGFLGGNAVPGQPISFDGTIQPRHYLGPFHYGHGHDSPDGLQVAKRC